MCQCRPSASVHSGEKMIWGGGWGRRKPPVAVSGGLPWPCPPPPRSLPWAIRHHLVAGLAARAQALGVVAAAVDLARVVEVDEVHQQLPARGAHKALRVPAGAQACAAGEHGDVSASDLLPALPGHR